MSYAMSCVLLVLGVPLRGVDSGLSKPRWVGGVAASIGLPEWEENWLGLVGVEGGWAGNILVSIPNNPDFLAGGVGVFLADTGAPERSRNLDSEVIFPGV